MKEAKGKTEKAAEGSLEPVLDAIETRVEALVDVVKSLAAENARLKTDLASAQAARDASGEAAVLLAKYEDERNAVRERIEKVLKTLEEGSGADQA